jgi:hypothetical protein
MEIALQSSSWLQLTNLLEYQGFTFWDATQYPDIAYSDNDQYVCLTRIQADQIDLVADAIYGDPKLYWVLLLANDKFYPNEFTESETIRCPAKTTIDQIFESSKSNTT